MNKNHLILTIDVGTQSTRTSLVNPKGEIVQIVKHTYKKVYISKKPGYAEQNPDYYFDEICSCLDELSKSAKDLFPNIIGATITTFRDSSVQLDEKNKPVRNCILWLDQRMADAKEKLPFMYRLLYKVVGMNDAVELNRKRTVANWLKENEPTTWSKTKKYVNISTYLTYKLTGNLIDCCCSFTGHYPIHFKKRVWYKPNALKGCIYGIPPYMLCDMKQPGEVLGLLNNELADRFGLPHDLKIIATGSDKSCETLGLGCLDNTSAAISCGTASTVDVSSKKYYEPEQWLPAYPSVVPDRYNLEVTIYRGYWMLTWFIKEFANDINNDKDVHSIATEKILESKLDQIPPGSEGLVLQPYWGPGLSRPLAKGAIVGFSEVHTREHLYRAIIEGIAYALREGLEGIEKRARCKVNKLMISGGGSQSDIVCQITSDIFGLPVQRVQTFETTTLGAAIATFTALGEFKSYEDAVKHMVHVSTTFRPNEIAHQQYEYLYKKVYLKMYPQLKIISKDINIFRKKKQ